MYVYMCELRTRVFLSTRRIARWNERSPSQLQKAAALNLEQESSPRALRVSKRSFLVIGEYSPEFNEITYTFTIKD